MIRKSGAVDLESYSRGNFGGIFGFGLLSLLLLMIIGQMFYPAIKIGAILLGVITFLLFCLVTGGRRKMKRNYQISKISAEIAGYAIL